MVGPNNAERAPRTKVSPVKKGAAGPNTAKSDSAAQKKPRKVAAAATQTKTVARARHMPARKARTAAQGTRHRAAAPPATGKGYLPERRSEFVIRILGNQRTADLLKVSKSQPSRWRSGQEAPGPAAARRLVDLDHVLARLALVWDESLLADWLTTPNGFLDGATPVDVIEHRGTAEVIEAIDAEAAGAFA